MALLERSEWYDIARNTNWTPKYVTEEDLFPSGHSGLSDVPMEVFDAYDEPYKISYREYVDIQRQKDAGVYSVKAALERANIYENAQPGWISTIKLHYGAVPTVEYHAALTEARFVRFAKAPGMRNMAVFGALDENRHTQLQLAFSHEYINKDRQFDWATQGYRTQNWGVIAARSLVDDMMMTRDVVETAIMANFALETGFTNLQFIGLSSDAANAGDYSFSRLIQSIQSDEARHAQIGTPLVKLMLANGHEAEAQKMVDISFWRCWKLFCVLTGIPMDYYMPLEMREGSWKEFMVEWIVNQFERNLRDLGLKTPWYWDYFLDDMNEEHHGQHIGTYSWRPTLWWNPTAGVTPDERDWLEDKYPGWNDTFGKAWDVVIDNMKNNRFDRTVPGTLPVICNLSHLPCVGIPFQTTKIESLSYKGRTYHFGSKVDRWIFEQDPERYASGTTIVDRLLMGKIDPPTIEGVLAYMGLGKVSDPADDSMGYSWVDTYKQQAAE